MDITSNSVAWYAALLATVNTVVIIINYLRDRPKVCIEYSKDMQIINGNPLYQDDKNYFNVTVINKGRRPIKITKAGLRIIGSEKKFIIFTDSFQNHRNKILTEESPTSEFLVEQNLINLENSYYIFAQDAQDICTRCSREYL